MKKDIKDTLKEFGITKVEFSKRFRITRQTLDNYIALFSNNEELPKDKYQQIFIELFAKPYNSKAKFIEKLERFENLLERDEKFGMSNLNSEETDLVMQIHRKSLDAITKDSTNSRILKFVDDILDNYESDMALIGVIDYYNYLNRKDDYNDDSDKVFVSNFHKLKVNYVHKGLEIDIKYLELFEKELERVRIDDEKNRQEIKMRIMEALLNDKKLNLDKEAINDLLDSLKI